MYIQQRNLYVWIKVLKHNVHTNSTNKMQDWNLEVPIQVWEKKN